MDEEDAKLFREFVGEVHPVRDDRVRSAPTPPKPRPLKRLEDERLALEESLTAWVPDADTGEELHWLRDGYPGRILRRLRRGEYRVQDEIDLHHMNLATARTVLRRFLAEAVAEDLSCVKVIHGKGLRSRAEGPKLKGMVAGLLPRIKNVVAMASARPNDGGTGAVYVLLRRRTLSAR